MHAYDVYEALLLLILIFKAPRSVLLGLIVKYIESSGKNVSTPPRMHFEKTKRMVMMSINSIVKFMGPVSMVKVLRRANIAIKCTCKCKK